jgi:hypothetical protein
MRIQFLKSVSTCIVFSTILSSTSCREEEIFKQDIAEEQKAGANAKLGIPTKLDEYLFAENIENYLHNVGFGYSIYVDGKEIYDGDGGDGYARKLFEEGGLKKHGALERQETLRTTQYVTALAVLKTIKKHNLSLQTKVWPYLPKDWVPSNAFKTLNFEQLLAHKTGLLNHFGIEDIKLSVEGKVNGAKFNSGEREDVDINYVLLGVMMPYVEAVEMKKKGDATKLNLLNKFPMNFTLYFEEFKKNVRQNVFVPAGLDDVDLIDWQAWDKNGIMSASLSTQGYPEKLGSAPGVDKPYVYATAGATGLYLSASEFAKLQSAVSQNKVVSAADYMLMKNKLFGFDGVLKGSKGAYYYKTGAGYNCETLIMDFGKVQVCILANSPNSDFARNPAAIAQVFENSLRPL